MKKNYLIEPTSTIKQSLVKMKKFGIKTLFIEESCNLIGSISDGDIRRGLLNNFKLNSKITSMINKKPKFIIQDNSTVVKKKSLDFFNKYKIEIIPVIDKNKKIIKFIHWADHLKKKNYKSKKIKLKKNLKVVIMAGGMGTRLKPYTNILPKPLVPVYDKTAIEHILDFFKNYGINNFIVTLNYKAAVIKLYLKELSKIYKINFFLEKIPLGTVGSLKFVSKNSDFILTNCDVIHKIDLKKFIEYHYINKNDLTLVVAKKDYQIPYGVCTLNKNFLQKIDEKPKHIFYVNTGLYIISKRCIKLIPKNTIFDVPNLIKLAKEKNLNISAFKISNSQWRDLGQWQGFKKNQL